MHDILCIYYSRSGNTRAAAEEIAAALDAELAEITDAQDRSGLKGYFRSGLDAMRRTVQPIDPLQTERPLTDYRLVILASPVWAGRCSSVVRAFLRTYGQRLQARRRAAARRLCPHARREPQIRGDLRSDGPLSPRGAPTGRLPAARERGL